MSYFNIVCDSCGRGVQGITWVNGMKFCAKCYQETFWNNTSKCVDLLNTEMYELKISNLEHKLNEKDQRIAELEEQFNNLLEIRYKTPHIERFAVVQYIHWEKKPYKIVKCFDAYKDKDFNIVPCFYDCGSTNFKVIQICDTKEDALKKLEELKRRK